MCGLFADMEVAELGILSKWRLGAKQEVLCRLMHQAHLSITNSHKISTQVDDLLKSALADSSLCTLCNGYFQFFKLQRAHRNNYPAEHSGSEASPVVRD